MNSFAESLRIGAIGESYIAGWFKNKGYSVLPVYEKEISEGKGPRLFCPDQQIVAPDMFVFNGEKCFWIEAKHKNGFSWHRMTNRWTTGIDIRHYNHYIEVDDRTPFPVWLVFLHRGGCAKDSGVSPAGLFGNSLRFLRENENHRSGEWGRSGMVYWAMDKLIKLAPYENPNQSAVDALFTRE